jgi:hypothetical protein
MEPNQYNLRIVELDESNGQIKAQDLRKLLAALLQTAERVTLLYATGESVSSNKPKWLENSTDFIVSNMKKGSTILELDAPRLLETADDQFSQNEFWRESLNQDDTALDLTMEAIKDACSEGESSDRYDSQVLDSMLKFKNALKSKKALIEIHSTKKPDFVLKLNKESFEKIENKKTKLPEARSFIVSGKLDIITYSAGSFTLLLSNGQRLLGKIHPEFLDEAKLKTYWGKDTTVEGMVHFKANGQPRLIEARKLTQKQSGDEIFDELPELHSIGKQDELFPELRKAASKADPMILWNLWEGDETVEELLAELD